MKRLEPLPWALLAVSLLVGKWLYDGRRRAEGADAVKQGIISAHRDSLKSVRDSLARAYRVDTVRLTKAILKRDTVRVAVDRWLTDTVPVPVEVVREIVRVDSVVIAACLTTVRTCEARVSALEADLAFSEQQTALWKRRASPSFLTRTSTALKWIGVGVGIRLAMEHR